MKRYLWILPFVAFLILMFAVPALAQDAQEGTVPPDEPWVGMLATTAGVAVIITIIMNLLRGSMPAATFDQYAPLIAAVIGIVLALLYVVVTEPVNGASLLQAVLVGLFAGGFSQNVNTIVRRAVIPPATTVVTRTTVPE